MARLLERIGKQFNKHAEWWADYGENLKESYNEVREDEQTMALVVEEMDANFREERKMKRSGFLRD